MTNLKMIDDLGLLLAQIADLTKKADAIKDALRAAGPGSYEGALFRATVGEDGASLKRDAQAMRDKLWAEGFYAFVKAHEQEVPRHRGRPRGREDRTGDGEGRVMLRTIAEEIAACAALVAFLLMVLLWAGLLSAAI